MSATTGNYVGDLMKVLAVNSQASAYEMRPVVRREAPGTGPHDDETGLIGSVTTARAGQHPRIRLTPFSSGPPGTPFHMRVTGWSLGRDRTDADPNRIVWMEHGIADFLCVTGPFPGKPTSVQQLPADRTLDPSEFLCDTIGLLKGSLGVGDAQGDLVSYGPGWNVAAHVSLALAGFKPFKVQFASPDVPLEMNAFWVPC